MPETTPKPSVFAIFLTFLKLGATGFGGPVALISLIDQECRLRLKWISAAQFNEAVLFCKLLPGPLAYQVALWVGKDLRGFWGGIAACLGFLIPGFSLILVLAIFYQSLHDWALFEGVLQGVRGAALIVILISLWKLAEPYKHKAVAWVGAGLGGLWMYAFPRWEPASILLGGLVSVAWRQRRRSLGLLSVEPFSLALLGTLLWVHFKAGAFVYGTGVAVLPFLQHEVVDLRHWLTPEQFLDGIAFGQVTPGPLTIASAFIGYYAAGFWGAVVATAGMYLPGMLLVLGVVPLIHSRLRGKQWLLDFQEGAMPIVVGGIAGAWVFLLPAAVPRASAGVLTAFLGVVAWRFPKLPAWGMMILGGVLGAVIFTWLKW
ncbi:chromate transporter [bacterium]|nr:chromate transporter [bacterium]